MHSVAGKETAGAHLLTMHNVHHLLALMGAVRDAIVRDEYPAFVRRFFARLYARREDYPVWAVGALRGVGVDLMAGGEGSGSGERDGKHGERDGDACGKHK